MYVCVCHAVTDSDIKNAVDNGARTMRDLGQDLRVGTNCGRCANYARELLGVDSNTTESLGRVALMATTG